MGDVDQTLCRNDFEWSKAVETGHDQIDSEHMKLFDLLSTLNKIVNGSVNDSITSVIGELKLYTVNHFRSEELLMESIKYEDIHIHKKSHAWFIQKLEQISSDKNMDVGTAKNCLELIYDWLFSHICSFDIAFVSKLHGGDNTFSTHWTEQTTKIIDQALLVANTTSKYSIKLNSTHDPELRKSLLTNINEMSERIVNLVTLISHKSGIENCSKQDIQRIKTLKLAVSLSALNLMLRTAKNIMDYGEGIIKNMSGVPIGCGSRLRKWLNEIASISDLIGTDSFISEGDIELVINAYGIANKVFLIENDSLKLTSYDRGREELKTRYELPQSVMRLQRGDSVNAL